MGMNPRLLRPILSGDPDALRYIAAVQTADQQSLEPAVRKAITDFIVGCKADGIWSAIKASCILMGARTLSGALTPLVGSAPTNNGPFVSGDYDRKTGLIGNGSTKYLNSNRLNDADPQNNQHLATYRTNTVGTEDAFIIAARITNTNGSSTIGNATAGTIMRSRSAASNNVLATDPFAPGFIGLSRSNSSTYSWRVRSSSGSATQASQAPLAQDVMVFANTSGQNLTSSRLAFYSIGESLDLALLDARVSALVTAIGAAI
jgi:hypothetical protein